MRNVLAVEHAEPAWEEGGGHFSVSKQRYLPICSFFACPHQLYVHITAVAHAAVKHLVSIREVCGAIACLFLSDTMEEPQYKEALSARRFFFNGHHSKLHQALHQTK